MRPPNVTVEDIRHRLKNGNVALVEYRLGSEGSYVFVVTPSRLRVHRLAKRFDIDRVTRRLYAILKTPGARWDPGVMNSYCTSAAKLSQMILAPISPDIAGRRLAIVADGFLNYIPFAAPPDMDTHDRTSEGFVPLFVSREIVKLPSAATLDLLDREPMKPKTGKTVAVLADPVFSREDERLKLAGMQEDPAEDAELTHASRGVRVRGMNLTRLYFNGIGSGFR
jgi:hypothetical protein